MHLWRTNLPLWVLEEVSWRTDDDVTWNPIQQLQPILSFQMLKDLHHQDQIILSKLIICHHAYIANNDLIIDRPHPISDVWFPQFNGVHLLNRWRTNVLSKEHACFPVPWTDIQDILRRNLPRKMEDRRPHSKVRCRHQTNPMSEDSKDTNSSLTTFSHLTALSRTARECSS